MKIRVTSIQNGGASLNKKANIDTCIQLLDKASEMKPDFVLFSELCTCPYFCGTNDKKYFEWAEPIPGPSIEAFSERAKKYGMHIIVPLFENASAGVYYNSAVLLDPKGNIIEGTLPNGEKVIAYRKNHIPFSYDEHLGVLRTNEKFFFTPGPGYPIYETELCKIGIMICYDKRYMEGWRLLELMGAQIVFHPMATWGWKVNTLEAELRTMATNCGYFVVNSSKGGVETLDYERAFVGNSTIVDPLGEIIAQGPSHEAPAMVHAELDFALIEKAKKLLPLARDRRPEIYNQC
jgi:beta-ureidopropionase